MHIDTNAVNEKGKLRQGVRDAIKSSIKSVTVNFANGESAELTYQGHGDFYGDLVKCDDKMVCGNAHLAITVNPYTYTAPRKPTKEPETIEVQAD
jgi:hypothetical protein